MTDIFSENRAFTRIFDQQVALYENYARRHGLQGKALYILLWLYHSPQGITQKRICERTYSSKQVVNATIKNWFRQGFITYRENPTDKRHKMVTLSPQGWVYATTILNPLQKIEVKAMDSLVPEQRQLFLQIFSHYNQTIRTLFEEGWQDQKRQMEED